MDAGRPLHPHPHRARGRERPDRGPGARLRGARRGARLTCDATAAVVRSRSFTMSMMLRTIDDRRRRPWPRMNTGSRLTSRRPAVISPPPIEKHQNANGITLLPAFSLAIHCTMKRAANKRCATMPNTTQKSNFADEHIVEDRADLLPDRNRASADLRHFRHALLAADQPPHAAQIEDADPQPVPHARSWRCPDRAAGRPRRHSRCSRPSRLTSAGRNRCRPSKYGKRQEQIAVKRLQPATGVAGAVAQDRAAHAVGDARLHPLEAGGLAADALSRDQADARVALRAPRSASE